MTIWEQAGYCPATEDGHPCVLLAGHDGDCDFMVYPRWYMEAMAL